ncbi:hypothetical protein D3C85_333770 [compost metagenome]
MLDSIEKLFELATHFPKITGFRKHVEPNTGDCTNIESVGVNVRSVNVEFIRYKHCGLPQTMVMIHCPERGSARFLHNDQKLCYSKRAGAMLYKLIQGDLEALVSEAEHVVFQEGMLQLEASEAIRKATRAVSNSQADEFVRRTSDGQFSTVSEFYASGE